MNYKRLKGSIESKREFQVLSIASHAALESDDKPALDKCAAQAYVLLAEPATPPYYRAKALLILANMAGDWVGGLDLHHKADIQLCVMRSLHAEGEDPDIDRALDRLQDSVDELRDALVEEAVLEMQDDPEDTEAEADATESDDTESDDSESDDIEWDDTESDDSAYQPDD